MKRALIALSVLALVSCSKHKNASPTVSAVNGCVVCVTTANVIEASGYVDLEWKSDSTICHISDSALKVFIADGTVSRPYFYNKAFTEKITTVCNNQ